MNTEEIIDKIYDIIIELDAREHTNNCVAACLLDKSWTELCEKAIELLEQIK